MVKRLEAVIYILPVFLVLVTALLDLGLAAGVTLAFFVSFVVYHVARSRGWADLLASVIRDGPRRPAE